MKDKHKKYYRVFQTISVFVEAENEVEAVEIVRDNDEETYRGWFKWDTEEVEQDDIVDFYPSLNKRRGE
tara:strand:- start:4277 stop:4483 length:207 start_codon:yes stop_codon:yes gene_type:complete